MAEDVGESAPAAGAEGELSPDVGGDGVGGLLPDVGGDGAGGSSWAADTEGGLSGAAGVRGGGVPVAGAAGRVGSSGGAYGRAVAAVIAAAVAFGTTGTARAKGPADTTALGVGAMRIVVGAAGLVTVMLAASARRRRNATFRSTNGPGSTRRAGGRLGAVGGYSGAVGGRHRGLARARRGAGRWADEGSDLSDTGSSARLWPCGRHLWLALVGGIGVAMYQPAFFAGTQRNGVAVGTIVALGSGPLFVGSWEALWLRRRPSLRWVGVTALALCGGTLLVAAQSGDTAAAITPFGVLCSLGAGLGYAVYALAGKQLIDDGVDSAVAMTWVFAVGAVLLSPALTVEPLGWLASGGGVLMALHLGLVTVTVGYLLYGFGLRTLAASTAVTLTLAEPLTAALAGVVVLGERLTLVAWCGAALVGVALLLTGRGRAVEPAASRP